MKKLALFLVLLLAVAAVEAQFAPGRKPMLPRFSGSTVEPPKPPVLFPEMSGTNLAGEEIAFPKALAGNYNLVFLVSSPEQEIFFETWLAEVRKLADRYENFRYFVLAELPPGPPKSEAARRWPLSLSSRPTLPEEEHRKVVMPIYTDRRALHEKLELTDNETLHILYVDGKNEVIWNDEGVRTNGKTRALEMQMARTASGDR